MADNLDKDTKKTPDPLAAVATQISEPTPAVITLDSPLSEKSEGTDSHSQLDEKSHIDDAQENELTPTRTNATDASVGTTATAQPSQEKTWKQKINPLRWGAVPPIPQERIQSREYGASIFSKLFFNWMTPLMTVSLSYQQR